MVTAGGDVDLEHAVEIADRVWWVGMHLPDDHFQCHVYLLEHGDQSVLFDPGGLLTFEHVYRKVCEVVSFDQIRWFVCHHQDPDITACVLRLDALVTRPDAALVTHWRAAALLKHYGSKLPFWLIDEHEWSLDLGGRKLQFVFTPYLHFPGAFTTFDQQSGTLFSSDLFGGFTEDEALYAADESYFENMRPFHEHYMPSREILAHGLEEIETLPLKLIAPQHGKIIREDLVAPIIARLKTLDCGLYLMVHQDTDIRRLSTMNQLLTQTMRRLIVSRDFREVATALIESARVVFPVHALEFYAEDPNGTMLHFSPANRYRGKAALLPSEWAPLMDVTRHKDPKDLPCLSVTDPEPAIGISLFSVTSERPTGVAVLKLDEPAPLHEATVVALAQLSTPLEVALEREMLLREVESQRQRFYELAMHDPLTGLYNRLALKDPLKRLFAIQDRGEVAALAVTMLDIDHFKRVNDTYGHAAGDEVLARVAGTFTDDARAGDLVARVGGEEFAVFHVVPDGVRADGLAERLRTDVAALRFSGDLAALRVTVSAGVACRQPGEVYEELLARADAALYEAKESGRDRTVIAPDPRSPEPA